LYEIKKQQTRAYFKLACLHDQNKSGFFGRPAFIQPIKVFENLSDFSDWLDKSCLSSLSRFLKTYQIFLIGWIKAGPPKRPLLF